MGKNQRQRAAQKSRERQFLFEPPGAATAAASAARPQRSAASR